MPELSCNLSTGLWELLQEHSQRTRQPAGLIVSKALADYFDVAHYALDNDLTLKQAALKLGFVAEEEFDRVVDPAKMVHPYVAKVS